MDKNASDSRNRKYPFSNLKKKKKKPVMAEDVLDNGLFGLGGLPSKEKELRRKGNKAYSSEDAKKARQDKNTTKSKRPAASAKPAATSANPPAASAKPAASAPKTEAYKIKKGDTISELAKIYGTTVGRLLKANPSIKDANSIRVGQTIKINPLSRKNDERIYSGIPTSASEKSSTSKENTEKSNEKTPAKKKRDRLFGLKSMPKIDSKKGGDKVNLPFGLGSYETLPQEEETSMNKKGGRIKYKSGGKIRKAGCKRGMGKALRGY